VLHTLLTWKMENGKVVASEKYYKQWEWVAISVISVWKSLRLL